jgi:hypothetical protein
LLLNWVQMIYPSFSQTDKHWEHFTQLSEKVVRINMEESWLFGNCVVFS